MTHKEFALEVMSERENLKSVNSMFAVKVSGIDCFVNNSESLTSITSVDHKYCVEINWVANEVVSYNGEPTYTCDYTAYTYHFENAVKPEGGNNIEVVLTYVNDELVAECEKNDDARSIFKSLNLSWNHGAWRRRINKFTGSYIDRASELANKLMLKGFTVVCTDADVLKCAASADYKEECKYWVRTYKESDKLHIKLYEKNDSIYNAAKNIKSARWDGENKSLAVDVSHYEDVLLFADDVGMKVTDSAMNMIQEYKDRLKSIPVVNLVAKEKKKESALDEILNSEVGIIDDLKD